MKLSLTHICLPLLLDIKEPNTAIDLQGNLEWTEVFVSQISRSTMAEHLLPFIWPKTDKEWTRTSTPTPEQMHLNKKKVNQNRRMRPVTTATTPSTTTTEWRKQLAPNCQHLSPQKIPLNEKATCQTSSSSLSLTPFRFSLFLPPLLLHLLVSSVTAPGSLSPSEAAMTVSAIRLRLLRTPAAALSLHSFATNTSSFCLFLLVFLYPQNGSSARD